ncbi:NAD(P)-dependent oxidoreductase [Protaetiibacter intestinalis]|uniref:NAD(P)-dependent oxidoreductase n=2 Tax=Protaetiibacter intestinalis TaxID=2419774 RepID=A0A387BM17_9MICO|nr:NAD(P)-dependent oxidoreductase [Protaetiibacter intestinalis]
MGAPMSRRLVAAGHRVRGFDVSEETRRALAEAGGEPAGSLAEAASDAGLLILMLPDSRVVEQVIGDEGLLAALVPGSIVVDMSSSEPAATRALAARLDARGVELVDAPVSGGVKGAVAGSLTIMVGGSNTAVARVRPVLEELGTVVHAGPVGSGHAIKALNNLLSATHLWITAEAMAVGQRFGLDPEVMLSIFNSSSGRSGSTENKWPNFVLTGRYDSGFGLRLMLKDMRIAVGLADQLGAPSALGADAVELWARAAEGLPERADHTEVAKWVQARGGA